MLQEKAGETAGKIWTVLNEKGAMTLKQIKKKQPKSTKKTSISDWAGYFAKTNLLSTKKAAKQHLN